MVLQPVEGLLSAPQVVSKERGFHPRESSPERDRLSSRSDRLVVRPTSFTRAERLPSDRARPGLKAAGLAPASTRRMVTAANRQCTLSYAAVFRAGRADRTITVGGCNRQPRTRPVYGRLLDDPR